MFTPNLIRYIFFNINLCKWEVENNYLYPGSLVTAQVTTSIGCETTYSSQSPTFAILIYTYTKHVLSIIDFVYLFERHSFIGRNQDVYGSATDS